MGLTEKEVSMLEILTKIQEVGLYRPTIKEVRIWFAILNDIVFHGVLPKFRYIILNTKKCYYGACNGHELNGKLWCELELQPEFKDFAFFIAILAHEMIHMYQWTINKRGMSHGPYFWVWAKEFKKYDIPLFVKYKMA
jgi:hypothetical protein